MHPTASTIRNVIRRGSAGFASVALIAVVLTACCGCTAAPGAENSGYTAQDVGDIQAAPSHSSSADPNYSVVFPDDRVNVMTITIAPENWQKMLDNMTELYGEFGGGQGKGGTSDINPVYVPADVSFEDQVWTDVGIRFKGQVSLGSTWKKGSYKISFKLNFDKFEDENPAIKNQRFYGFDELGLQSGYTDNSLMRDMIVPSIFRDSGVPAPHTAFYRVYLDHGEGPIYFGLYTMIESVEDTVIKTQFEDDSGNVYKPEGAGATFARDTFDTASFKKKTNKKGGGDWTDVETLYTILNSETRTTDPETWRSELETILDVDEFLRWLATNTVIQNWDTYGGHSRNFYLYTDPTNGRIVWIPWDNNLALNSGKRTPSLDLGNVGEKWPLIHYLADDPVYYAQYLEYLEMVVTTSFEPMKMEETYRYYHALIEPYVTGPDGEQAGYTHLKNAGAFDASLDALIDHAYDRHDAVMDFLSTERTP